MKYLRFLLLVLAILLLAYALTLDSKQVYTLDKSSSQMIGGYEYVQGTAADRFMRRDGVLYDTWSGQVPASASLDDCPT